MKITSDRALIFVTGCLFAVGCFPSVSSSESPALIGQDVRLTVLHTSDIHSRLLEYEFDPSYTDNQLGLADDMGPYGGIDKIGYRLKKERADAGRVLHLDSGDCLIAWYSDSHTQPLMPDIKMARLSA